jgi:LCP family protein required for cell wall assembly
MTDGDDSPGGNRDLGERVHLPAPDPATAGPASAPGPPSAGGAPGARRPAGTLSAQQRLVRQIAAGRRARRQRAVLAVLAGMSSLVLLISGGGWLVTSYVTGHIGRLSAGTSGTPSSGPLNILVAGVDIRAGLSARQQARLHVGHAISDNSDTLMVVHIPADHSYVQVVSLPRDSWVTIPGHGMNKINAAFGLGGPRLMVRTVEAATGLVINDYVEVNFLGFVKVIDAVGGVNICLPFAVDDSYSGLDLSAGRHHVDGVTALEFARDRHSFATSDLARIDDQQQLLSTMLSQSVSAGTLSDPFKLRSLLSSVTSAIRVDRGFNMVELANQLRGIRPGDVAFSTVPLATMNYQTPTGQSAVLWDASQAGKLFAQIKDDQRPAVVAPPPRRRKRGHHGQKASGRSQGAAASSPDQERTAAQDTCR